MRPSHRSEHVPGSLQQELAEGTVSRRMRPTHEPPYQCVLLGGRKRFPIDEISPAKIVVHRSAPSLSGPVRVRRDELFTRPSTSHKMNYYDILHLTRR
jgi:hypothetical protein